MILERHELARRCDSCVITTGDAAGETAIRQRARVSGKSTPYCTHRSTLVYRFIIRIAVRRPCRCTGIVMGVKLLPAFAYRRVSCSKPSVRPQLRSGFDGRSSSDNWKRNRVRRSLVGRCSATRQRNYLTPPRLSLCDDLLTRCNVGPASPGKVRSFILANSGRHASLEAAAAHFDTPMSNVAPEIDGRGYVVSRDTDQLRIRSGDHNSRHNTQMTIDDIAHALGFSERARARVRVRISSLTRRRRYTAVSSAIASSSSDPGDC